MSALLSATINEDIFAFGKEMTKSLHSLTSQRKAKVDHSFEKNVHELLLIYSKDLEKTKKYSLIAEHRADFNNDGIQIDIHLKPTEKDSNSHYLIEVKRYKKDDEGIHIKAVEGIAQTFNKTYRKSELHSKETTGIIMMRLAVQHDNIYLISQKLTVDDGLIVDLGTIRIQKFWIDDKSGDEIKVDYDEPIERKIKKPIFKKDPKQEEIKKDYNKRMNARSGEYMVKKYKELIGDLMKQTDNNKEQANGIDHTE
jgi:hypothetical protein